MRKQNKEAAKANKVVLEELAPSLEQEYLDGFTSYSANNKSNSSALMAQYLEEIGYMLSGK